METTIMDYMGIIGIHSTLRSGVSGVGERNDHKEP